MKYGMLIHPDELSDAWIDRLSDAGVQRLGIHPRGGLESTASLTELLDLMQTKEFRRLIDRAVDKGLEIEYEFHCGGYFMPAELFDTHPEYFRMDENGNRVKNQNFCVSNQKVLDLLERGAAKLASSLYKSSHSFYFWLDDGHGLHCRCEKCSKLSPSDQQMIAVNTMQKGIRSRFPDARISYLAYMDTVVPPTKIRPADGVFLEYAPFEKYTAKGENAEALILKEREMLLPLKDFFRQEPCKVLEYWFDNSMLSHWKKPPKKFILDEDAMSADIEDYRKMGFDAISTFACFLGKDYEELYGGFDISPFTKHLSKD